MAVKTPDPGDLDALARRYLDLWQDHLLATASDPESIAILGSLIAAAGTGMAAHADLWRRAWELAAASASYCDAAAVDPSGSKTRPAPGAPPAGDASDHGDRDLAEFARRITALEERLAALESGPPRSGGTPRRRSRRGTAS